MSWNNAAETIKHKNCIKATEKKYRAAGMNESQIEAMRAYENKLFGKVRYNNECGTEVSMYCDDGEEIIADLREMAYHDNVMEDPFEFGFADSRLNKIWQNLSDEIDKIIFVMLSKGCTQNEIGVAVGMSQKGVSKRIARLKKIF
jgi:hypothetical protein